MQSGIRAVDDVDVAAVVRSNIIRLDHPPADIRIALIGAAPIVGVLSYRGDEIGDVLRIVWIADIECADAGIEIRHENDLFVEGRPELLICRVRAKAPAPIAEP